MDSKALEELHNKYIKNPPEGGISYYKKAAFSFPV